MHAPARRRGRRRATRAYPVQGDGSRGRSAGRTACGCSERNSSNNVATPAATLGGHMEHDAVNDCDAVQSKWMYEATTYAMPPSARRCLSPRRAHWGCASQFTRRAHGVWGQGLTPQSVEATASSVMTGYARPCCSPVSANSVPAKKFG